MKNFFKKLFSIKEKSQKSPKTRFTYRENKWRRARIKDTLKFKNYSKSNRDNLKEISGKNVYVRKVSAFFFVVQGSEILVFLGDFKSLDDPYRKQVSDLIHFPIPTFC